MTITVTMFRDEGPVISARGAPREVDNFNMKNSNEYSVLYFPSASPSAPLVRSLVPGEQVCSYTVYTYFKLEGTYNVIKNTKLILSLETPTQATNTQLFYKLTNVYQEPTNALDPDMMLAANGNTLNIGTLFPNLSTVGPHMATSRAFGYANVSPLYTNYFVTQVRVGSNGFVGNTPEFKLRFECKEYGVF